VSNLSKKCLIFKKII